MAAEENTPFQIPVNLAGSNIKKFEYAKLADHWTLDKAIGRGAYGKVFSATNKKTKERNAVKFTVIEEGDGIIATDAIREICVPRLIDHPNIIRFNSIQIFELTKEEKKKIRADDYHMLGVGMPIFDGSLERKNGVFNKTQLKQIFFQMLVAIHILKQYNVLHCDIKPPNFFFKREGDFIKVVLGDFGIAQSSICDRAAHDSGSLMYTALYRPPELFPEDPPPVPDEYSSSDEESSEDSPVKEYVSPGPTPFQRKPGSARIYNFEPEIWATAVSFYELAYDEPIHERYDFMIEPASEWLIERLVKRFEELTDENVKDQNLRHLLNWMLRQDPRDRPTAEECLTHAYFDSIREDMEARYSKWGHPLNLMTESCPTRVRRKFVPSSGTFNLESRIGKFKFKTFRNAILGDLNTKDHPDGWLFEVAKEHQLNSQTTALAAHLVENILVQNAHHLDKFKAELQGITCACLYLSEKLYEIDPLDMGSYKYVSNDEYSETELMHICFNLLQSFDWNIDVMTLYDLVASKQRYPGPDHTWGRFIQADYNGGNTAKEMYDAFKSLSSAEAYGDKFLKASEKVVQKLSE